MIEFELNKKLKRKARRRRQRGEKKWLFFRIAIVVFMLISILSFVVGMFVISSPVDEWFDSMAIVFSISLILCVMVKGVLSHI